MGNYLFGHSLKLLSFLIIQLNPSLKNQLFLINQKISKSTSQIKNIPEHLINSLIIIEDKRFRKHHGIDFYGILRALKKNATTKRLEGASTIVQQLVRNITNEREINIKRKLREIILATLIDKTYSKDEILFAYFDTYIFDKCIGIFNFCKSENYELENLTINQSAEIAARFKYPILRKTNYVKYLKRVRIIEIKNYAQ